jgi:hypothetical protein
LASKHWYLIPFPSSLCIVSSVLFFFFLIIYVRKLNNVFIADRIDPGKEYSYQISIDDAYLSPLYTFRFFFSNSDLSPLTSEKPLKLALISDSQDGVIEFKQHLSHIRDQDPSLLIHNGDLTQVFFSLHSFLNLFI